MTIVYQGSLQNEQEMIRFFRRESGKLRSLRKLTVSREGSVVRDVNGDTMEFPGLSYGNPLLERLLEELGVIFSAQSLHDGNATPDGIKEFGLSARHPWGEDRVM